MILPASVPPHGPDGPNAQLENEKIEYQRSAAVSPYRNWALPRGGGVRGFVTIYIPFPDLRSGPGNRERRSQPFCTMCAPRRDQRDREQMLNDTYSQRVIE